MSETLCLRLYAVWPSQRSAATERLRTYICAGPAASVDACGQYPGPAPARLAALYSYPAIATLEGQTMRTHVSIAAVIVAAGLTASAFAQSPPPVEPAPGANLLVAVTNPAKDKLTVTTPGWKNGEDIPFQYTQYQGNNFPGLEWSKGPAATKSYAIIM